MTICTKPIDTAELSQRLRARAIDVAGRRLLVSRLAGSDQETDIAVPTNCGGYGRIRHFRFQTSPGWPRNPLPIVPACRALGLTIPKEMKAQVFQNAACAWRCWYCFVPYNLLSADPKRSAWLTAEQLTALYKSEINPPLIIDLSGGSPDLVPEWTLWMMEALVAAGLDRSTYLWSDDNLSTTYLFDFLNPRNLKRLRAYRNYGRACCFKGFDGRSFAFNTRAPESDFERQFEMMGRLLQLGLDTYGYITLTAPDDDGVSDAIRRLMDKLQLLHPNLPLRIVPLEIREFSPVTARLDTTRKRALRVQQEAIAVWDAEIEKRFDSELRRLDIAEVQLSRRDLQ